MRRKIFKIFNMESKLYKIVLGIAVHAIYLYSIFDIYFTSPLVHGMTPHRSSLKPPAKRLVLFVADGLRADKLFENQISRAPFIRDVIFNYGRWGVSHTRVPTESRPGHVAIIAGFYEDVSAVAKGWKENPVEFDSVFNESRYTWSWGSPDILPMFSKGASGTHVIMDMYDATLEDFAAQDHYLLDRWVFEKVAVFFKNANESLQYKLQADQNVFFLHLLGIDTNGHAHRPMSAEYLGNIEYVDEGVKQAYEMFEDYFNHDKLTAYILTSDHGMTNWGSHGAGHAHETLTPLVAWGAGIHHPENRTSPEYNDGLAENWGLSMIKRSDVLQADIAPLMASLIGIPFPMNSVGVLPLDYLNNTDLYKTENIFVNAKQILAQFQIKERSKKESAFIFKPFSELIGSKQMAFIRDITTLTKSGKYHLARNLSQDLIELSLKGLNYYQKYDRIPLSVMVTMGFLGWIACVILQIFTTNTEKSIKSNRGFIVSTLFTGTGCMAGVGLLIVNAPLTHYVYLVIPLFCWHYIVQRWVVIKRFCTTSRNSFLKLSLGLLLVVFGLEVLVLSFFNRFALSIGLIVLAMWPLSTSLVRTHRRTVALWVASCVALAIFPMLPVVGRDSNYLIVTIAGILSAIEAILIILAYKKNKGTLTTRTKKVFSIQFLILILAVLILNHSRYNISLKLGLPILNSIFSWSTLFCCIVLPPMVIDSLVLRLLSTNISLMSVYVLLCTSYEALFFVVLSSAMALWLTLEYQLSTGNNFISLVNVTVNEPFEGHAREVSMDDLRSSFFFVYFIITAFFGTGNIASINTFDPATVYCFLTVFSPFIMGTLLILKILIPFVTVTCVFDAVHVVCRVPVNRLFLFVLIMTDLMALQFFYFVRDYGSWLEIGTSISHYVIMLCFIIFLFFIFTVANFFTRNTSWSSGKIHIQ